MRTNLKTTLAQCQCPDQFILSDDGRTCVDFDECSHNNGGCQGACVNLSPGYQCACPGQLLGGLII